ncbi:MAG: hypothetical protein V8T45_07295 [Oscillospiraceae bacterium]
MGGAIGGNVLLFEDLVQAHLGGQIRSGGNVDVTADSDITLYNIGLSLAGSGTAAVGGVAIVSYFTGTTEALLLSGSSMDAKGDFSLLASSNEFITADGAGIAGSGTAAVSGTVDLIVTKLITRAEVLDNASGSKPEIKAAGITIDAKDNYQLIGAAATAAFSGTAAVGITAIVTIAKNSVSAGIGDNYDVLTTAKDVLINALSTRDIRSYAASLEGSGTAAAGVVLMATVVGSKLDDDSSQALQKYFDAEALINGSDDEKGMKDKAPAGARDIYDGLSEEIKEDISGSGNSYSDVSVGTTEQKKDSNGNPLYYDADNNETTTDTGRPVLITIYDGNDQYLSEDISKEYIVTQDGDGQVTAGEPGDTDLPLPDLASDGSDRGQAADIGFDKLESTDSTRAFIGDNTGVTSAGNISVEAKDLLNASLVTASVGVSGAAGFGVGMAVAILNSNVEAVAGEASVLSAKGNIHIEAFTGAPSSPAAT